MANVAQHPDGIEVDAYAPMGDTAGPTCEVCLVGRALVDGRAVIPTVAGRVDLGYPHSGPTCPFQRNGPRCRRWMSDGGWIGHPVAEEVRRFRSPAELCCSSKMAIGQKNLRKCLQTTLLSIVNERV